MMRCIRVLNFLGFFIRSPLLCGGLFFVGSTLQASVNLGALREEWSRIEQLSDELGENQQEELRLEREKVQILLRYKAVDWKIFPSRDQEFLQDLLVDFYVRSPLRKTDRQVWLNVVREFSRKAPGASIFLFYTRSIQSDRPPALMKELDQALVVVLEDFAKQMKAGLPLEPRMKPRLPEERFKANGNLPLYSLGHQELVDDFFRHEMQQHESLFEKFPKSLISLEKSRHREPEFFLKIASGAGFLIDHYKADLVQLLSERIMANPDFSEKDFLMKFLNTHPRVLDWLPANLELKSLTVANNSQRSVELENRLLGLPHLNSHKRLVGLTRDILNSQSSGGNLLGLLIRLPHSLSSPVVAQAFHRALNCLESSERELFLKSPMLWLVLQSPANSFQENQPYLNFVKAHFVDLSRQQKVFLLRALGPPDESSPAYSSFMREIFELAVVDPDPSVVLAAIKSLRWKNFEDQGRTVDDLLVKMWSHPSTDKASAMHRNMALLTYHSRKAMNPELSILTMLGLNQSFESSAPRFEELIGDLAVGNHDLAQKSESWLSKVDPMASQWNDPQSFWAEISPDGKGLHFFAQASSRCPKILGNLRPEGG